MSTLNRKPPGVRPLYVDRPTAAAIVSLSESSWEKLVREGDAPQPRKISPGRVGWLLREIEAWAEQRPVSDLLPPRNTQGRAATRRSEHDRT